MMIKPFLRPMATTKRSSDSVILSKSGGVHPFPDDVLVLLMVPVIFHCRFAGKISLLGARWECSSGLHIGWRSRFLCRLDCMSFKGDTQTLAHSAEDGREIVHARVALL